MGVDGASPIDFTEFGLHVSEPYTKVSGMLIGQLGYSFLRNLIVVNVWRSSGKYVTYVIFMYRLLKQKVETTRSKSKPGKLNLKVMFNFQQKI